ncbi:glycosyltransferase family 2 protein [Cryobacterium sp. TMT1-3]|uniref:Glycosyltransferase family 2 protein n=1 Tax=Cryobacterium luteum TaxID=1424661 RepID=A0A1H8BNS3_9MICO|nr:MULTISPECIES: glycosyltransferase family 2 protein [Cryobacterium]TFB89060.1 glycosyltransferase family 2 protein [Cryobacterium luteum]TFC29604.1 glycosyltransferase family 2 protein [Cryobacterium sp. TMT1-3]SEM83547.1 Glycosyltransferase, GT2 family [Cryobacterium luteum]
MTDTNLTSLTVVVVNFGSSALLEENLQPLSRSAPGLAVVVVDNFTDVAEQNRVSALAEREGWQHVLSPTNLGFGGGMNVGVARAQQNGCAHFLLLNPDAAIVADQVARLLDVVSEHPLTLVSPRILRPDGTVWFDGSDLYLDDGRVRATRRRTDHPGARTTPWLSGACLLVSDELWCRIGGFSDDYFLYWEDVELSQRALQVGGTVAVCADAQATHAQGGTQGGGQHSAGQAKSYSYYYYNVRNRLVYAARNLDAPDRRRWRRRSVPAAWEVIARGGRRQLLTSVRPLIAAARGLRDGLAYRPDPAAGPTAAPTRTI